jgi:hypothetical protein
VNEIIYEVFNDLPCQEPGSRETTKKAFNLKNLDTDRIQIFDIGCDTGA